MGLFGWTSPETLLRKKNMKKKLNELLQLKFSYAYANYASVLSY